METKNATISSTFLGFEDHGLLTFQIHMKYFNGGQSFGNYQSKVEHIEGILNALDERAWEDLPGTACRVRCDQAHIESIGHFLKESWYKP